MGNISDNVSLNINYILTLTIYIYQSDYLSSSSVVVLSQLPPAVRVRQDVLVSLPPTPPQTWLPSWLWELLEGGSDGTVQCWPVEGDHTSTSVRTDPSSPPDINNPRNINKTESQWQG